jgi:hypothetical protein
MNLILWRVQVEGKAWVRVDAEPDADGKCKVVVGCDLEGKWVLHWGVSYDGETGRYDMVCTRWQ